MAHNTPQPERNASILTLWNEGAGYPAICTRLGLKSINVVAGALNRARDRGEYVRPDGRPRHKAKARGETKLRRRRAATPQRKVQSYSPIFPVNSTSKLNELLRKARSRRTAQEISDSLPKEAKQCRWPDGDYLNGDLHACTYDRKDKDIPLANDPLPYCEAHRGRAVDKQRKQVRVRITMHPRYQFSTSVRT